MIDFGPQTCKCGNDTYNIVQTIMSSSEVRTFCACSECNRVTGTLGRNHYDLVGKDYTELIRE